MLLEAQECQVVLLDYQLRLMPALHESGLAIANAVSLAYMAGLMQVPTFVTEQNPAKLGETLPELRNSLAKANAKFISKMHFSAVQAGLADLLRPPAKAPAGNARSLPKHLQKAVATAPERNTVVLAGCEAHVCLLQTALELLDDEFEVWVVTDACSSRTERNRDAAFDRLASAGVELVTTEMVAFEWLRTAEHPAFKSMQSLIK